MAGTGATTGQGPDGRRAPADFRGRAAPLDGPGPWLALAAELGCEPAALRAVARVESRGRAFLPSRRPPILFERHIFHRLTAGRFAAVAPTLSAPAPGGYGAGGEAQYARLTAALALDRAAALAACSWGRFQIMGFNAGLCGWPDVEGFVADQCDAEAAQLAAFGGFLRATRLDRALAARDWAAFARGYNGPAHKGYDLKLAAAYAAEAGAEPSPARPFRVETVAALQTALAHLGARPGAADGLMGPLTRAAIARFEDQCRLPVTGAASPTVMAAAQAAYYALGGPDRGPV